MSKAFREHRQSISSEESCFFPLSIICLLRLSGIIVGLALERNANCLFVYCFLFAAAERKRQEMRVERVGEESDCAMKTHVNELLLSFH